MAIESLILTLGYPVMFAGSFIEGPSVMIMTGFLLRLGYFHFVIAFVLLFLGDILGDFFWYCLGRYGVHRTIVRIEKFFDVSEGLIEKIKEKFRSHEGKILFGSKLTAGFGFGVPIMMAAGMSRVPFRKFSAYIFSGGLIWAAMLMSIGYIFGNVYLQLEKGFRIVFLVILVAMIAAALYGFSRYMKKTFLNKL